MTTVINLGTLGSEGFIAVGGSAELAGWSVSEAGDVNGDGYSEVIIGAPLNDDGGDDAGKAYVIFGGPVGFADIDLDNLEPSEGFGIQGANVADLAGFSVSGAGLPPSAFVIVLESCAILAFTASAADTATP